MSGVNSQTNFDLLAIVIYKKEKPIERRTAHNTRFSEYSLHFFALITG